MINTFIHNYIYHPQSGANEVESEDKPEGSPDHYEMSWKKKNDKAMEEIYQKELRVGIVMLYIICISIIQYAIW